MPSLQTLPTAARVVPPTSSRENPRKSAATRPRTSGPSVADRACRSQPRPRSAFLRLAAKPPCNNPQTSTQNPQRPTRNFLSDKPDSSVKLLAWAIGRFARADSHFPCWEIHHVQNRHACRRRHAGLCRPVACSVFAARTRAREAQGAGRHVGRRHGHGRAEIEGHGHLQVDLRRHVDGQRLSGRFWRHHVPRPRHRRLRPAEEEVRRRLVRFDDERPDDSRKATTTPRPSCW